MVSRTWRCPSCRGVVPHQIALREVAGHRTPTEVAVSVVCIRCRGHDEVGVTIPLALRGDALAERWKIEHGLFLATGLGVVWQDPPGDPGAGVREPRRPPPDLGTLGEANPLP